MCALAELQTAPDAEKVRALLAGGHLGPKDVDAVVRTEVKTKNVSTTDLWQHVVVDSTGFVRLWVVSIDAVPSIEKT